MKIQIQLQDEVRENDRYWTFCVGSGHAALALRHDYQVLLTQAVNDLGFQRVRFHGLFNDDMQVVMTLHDLFRKIPKSKQVKTTSFYQIACIYDRLLEIGVKPFVEIGFMPHALASSKKHVFYYKGNVSMPKKQQEWSQLLKEFMRFLLDRYGEQEVSSWYFEIWNEPDLKGFFFDGTKQDYFELYKMSVEAIREILPNAIVGGPATSQNRWVKDFRLYCEEHDIPLDFLSTHHYPGDDVGLPLITKDNVKRFLCSARNNQGKTVWEVFHMMMDRSYILPYIKKDSMLKQMEQAQEESANIPLIYTEWNVNPTCTSDLHDSCVSASYVVKHVLDGQYRMKGCSFWAFSDIFEENTFFSEPFSGSFGLMNIHGIPKPSYWAFYLLNQLGEKRYMFPITHEIVEYAVFEKQEIVQVLLYTQAYVQDDDLHEVSIALSSEHPIKKVTSTSINEVDCNPRKLWEDMGSPKYLSKDNVETIKQNSKPKTSELYGSYENDTYTLHVTIRTNEVILMQFYKEIEDENHTTTKENTM